MILQKIKEVIFMNTFNRIEIKTLAKRQISGNRGLCFGLTLCTMILSVLSAMNNPAGLAMTLLSLFFSYFMARACLMITDEPAGNIRFLDAFSGIDYRNLLRFVLVSFLFGLIVSIGLIVFILPGIYLAYKYYFVPYIVIDKPEISIRDAFKRSGELTSGIKIDLFVLELSFFGWILFGVVTLGLGMFYVIPYMNLTYMNAYRKASKED